MLLGLSASLLAGGVARFLQPLPGPGQPPPEYQRLLPDTKVRHLPSTGWRAIPVVLLTEKIVKTQRNSTQLKTTPKQLTLELDIVATCSPPHPTTTTNFSATTKPARELKFGTDTYKTNLIKIT